LLEGKRTPGFAAVNAASGERGERSVSVTFDASGALPCALDCALVSR